MKSCPNCKNQNLSDTILYNTEVDYCPVCLGLWFDEDELRWAKDEKNKYLSWLDIDLWKDEKKFKASKGGRLCPVCKVPLYEVYYGDSWVIVDVCNLCHGIWLDRAEFKKIISWLNEKSSKEIIHHYGKNLVKEMAEIFTGPETLKSEIGDVLVVLKMLKYKFSAKHPFLAGLFVNLPK